MWSTDEIEALRRKEAGDAERISGGLRDSNSAFAHLPVRELRNLAPPTGPGGAGGAPEETLRTRTVPMRRRYGLIWISAYRRSSMASAAIIISIM